MLILSFDTSAQSCGVALTDTEKVISEIQLNRGSKHSEQLLPMIDHVLGNAKKTIGDIDLIVVSSGPGSFTGVRIAVATAKALSQGREIPLVAVNSLELLASNCLCPKSLIVPMLDARKNEVYTALFRRKEEGLLRVSEDYPSKPSELFTSLKEEESVIFLGENIEPYRDQIKAILKERALLAPVSFGSIRASEAAFLGLEKYRAGDLADHFDLAPTYLRKPEAETSWEAKQGG